MAFSVLTAAQGATLRNRIGDTDTAAPKLSDTVLDAAYTAAGLDLACATVAALEELVGIYSMQTNIGGATQVGEMRNQRVTELQKRLDYWNDRCATSGGVISVGSLDLNLDTDLDDTDST